MSVRSSEHASWLVDGWFALTVDKYRFLQNDHNAADGHAWKRPGSTSRGPDVQDTDRESSWPRRS